MANKRIPELDPVVTAAQTDKFIVRQSGDVEDKHVDMDVMQVALLITESQITDLQSYLLVEANDLTAAVVWDDIPDANVPESAVTQHEAALSITESQISDLQAYLLAELNDLTAAVVWDDIPDVNVPESAVTQHEAALTITESQISDLAHTVGVSGLGIWKYRTETTAPPASGQIRFDNANISLATEFYLHETNEGGVDVSTFLELLLQDGSALFIQDKTDAGNSVLIEISSSTDNGVYRTFGIQSVTEQGTEPGQNDDVILLTTGLASAGGVVEVNDLTAAVTWDDIPDANVPESAVTQHVAAIDHDQLLNFAANEHFTQAAISITESQVSDLQAYLLDITGENIADLADVSQVSPTQFHVIARNAGNTAWESRLLVEADISNLGHTSEINDLSAIVTWANIPDVNVPESAVTQHVAAIDHDQLLNFAANEHFTQAAISITESQISDLQAYLLDITGEELADLSDVVSATNTNRFALLANGTTGYVGRALVEADISDLQAYLTSFTETNDLTAAVVWANVPDGNITESSVTQHEAAIDHDALTNFLASEHFTQAAISITESQISDLGAYLENIVEDTTPQLGADLDTNGFNIANLDTTLLDLSITAGSDASGDGGTLTLRAGASGGSSSKGGSVLIEATNGVGGGAEGGDVTINTGNASGSGDDGGDFLVTAGFGVGGGGNGGNASVVAGTSNGSGLGGIASLIGGEGNNGTGVGGIAQIVGGLGGTSGGIGGEAAVIGGDGVGAADGGAASVTGGTSTVSGDGGAANLVGGAGAATNGGGQANVTGGVSGSGATGQGGAVQITGGASAATNGDGGNVIISSGAGAGSGVDGDIFLSPGADGDVIIELGVSEFARFKEGSGNEQFVLAQNNSPALPTFAFGDGDSGFFESADDQVGVSIAGAQKWFWAADQFSSILSGGASILHETATDTNPTLIPFRTAPTTGIGGVSGTVALIGSGVTLAKTVGAASGGLQANNTLTGAGLERVLTTGDLPAAPVVIDVVQARRTTDLILTTSYVDVTLDTTDVESDSAEIEHDAVTDRVVVKTTGLYEIGYEVDVETQETSGSLLITADGRVRVNDTGVDVPGSIAQAGSFRDTSLDGEHFNNHLSNSFFVNLTANDFVTLQLRKTELSGAGSGQFEAVRTTLKVKRLQ
ncbi:MAG: hypothetical protein KAJ55_13140 [Anaerolineales bacterium]|nr:hypothetical protein [Anaerolineales bacterium]